MSRNSSISSSSAALATARPGLDAGRYLALALGGGAVILALLLALITGSSALGRVALPYQALYQHQTAKLDAPVAGTLFVGDSSLGNAIDAALWSELGSATSANLALTGSYGFAGSLNMLRRSLRAGRPRRVVIMHTADMLMRPSSDSGYLMAADDSDLGLRQRLGLRWRRTMNVDEALGAADWAWRTVLRGGRPPAQRQLPIENDYVRQGRPIVVSRSVAGFSPDAIDHAGLGYLAEIGDLCRREGLDCLFAFGPLAEPICGRSDAYFRAAAAEIERAGLPLLAARPVCLAAHEVGDSNDHVRPSEKARFTRLYHQAIAAR